MHHADDGARSLTLTNSSHIEYRESPGGLTDFLSRGASGGGGGGRERPEKTNQVSTNAVPSAAGDLRVWPSSSNQSSGIPPRPLLAVGLNPKRIIKGSFLQEAPHITLPPLNHICSAISSSSTCSNFALEKKISLCCFSVCFAAFCCCIFIQSSHLFHTHLFTADHLQTEARPAVVFSMKVSRHLTADTCDLLKNTNTGNKRGHISSRDHGKLN